MNQIDPVATEPGAPADVLALLDERQAPGAVVQDSGATAEPAATSADVDGGAKKGGRPRKDGERTPGGRLKRVRRSTPGAGRRFTRADAAATVDAAPATAPALTGDVKDGPVPETTPRRVPTAEEVGSVVPLAALMLKGVTTAAARMMKSDRYKLTPDELATLPEAVARFYLFHYPNGVEDSPGVTLFLLGAMYLARATGLDGTGEAAAQPSTAAAAVSHS